MLKIHHLDTSMCLVGSKLFPSGSPPRVCGHCMAIETDQGLVFVDTWLGREDVASPTKRLGIDRFRLGADYLPERCAIHQLKGRGFNQSDVRHIVLTHMDLDHAGRVAEFPYAQLHAMRSEPTEANRARHLAPVTSNPELDVFCARRSGGAESTGRLTFSPVRDARDRSKATRLQDHLVRATGASASPRRAASRARARLAAAQSLAPWSRRTLLAPSLRR